MNNYYKVNQNTISNSINYSLIKSKKDNEIISIDMHGFGVVKIGALEYHIGNFKEIKKFISSSTGKLFVYSIMKMQDNESNFSLIDYMYFRNLLDRKSTAEKLKNDLKVLQIISNIEYSNKRKDTLLLRSLLLGATYKYGKINIEFNPEFAERLKENYMFIHKNLLKVNDRKYPHVWPLGYYIFEYARINKKCSFKLSIKSCLKRLALPHYKKVRKTNRNYTERIIDPFENTIDTIMEYMPIIDIEYEKDNETIMDFFKNKLIINIKDDELKNHYKEIDLNAKRKSMKYNKETKSVRIEKANKLRDEGCTIKEIAEILKLTERTIKEYFK